MLARVKRGIDSKFRSREEQVFLLRVFPHGPHKMMRRNALNRELPRLAVVMRDVKQRRLIVEPMPIDRRIGSARVEVRSLDHRNLAPRRNSRRSNIRPRLAAVQRNVNPPRVASRPYLLRVQRRRRNRIHDSVAALLGVVRSGRPFAARPLHRARQVRADL